MTALDDSTAFSQGAELAKKTDWRSPVTLLAIATIGLGFFAGGHFMKIGLFLGVGMSLGTIILLNKCPDFVLELCERHPLGADLLFTSLTTWMVAAFFGQGLTLGIAAITTGVVLSWGIPALVKIRLHPNPVNSSPTN